MSTWDFEFQTLTFYAKFETFISVFEVEGGSARSSRCSSARATCGGIGSVSTRTRSSSARRSTATAPVTFPASWRPASSAPRRRACPRARWHPAARAARTARGGAARGKACAGLPGAGTPEDCAAPPPARPQGCRMRTGAAAVRGRAASVSCCLRRTPRLV